MKNFLKTLPSLPQVAIIFVCSALAVSFLIYLTPLKHLNLIEPKIKDVKAEQIYQEIKKEPEKYLFIDVRPKNVYDRLHAEGAINIPLQNLYNDRFQLPKKGKTIVLICSGGIASGVGYHYLEHHGFLNLLRVEGGIEAWQESGLPLKGSVLK